MEILTQVQNLLQGSKYVIKVAEDAKRELVNSHGAPETLRIILIVEPNESGGFIRGTIFQDSVLVPGQIVFEVHGKLASDHGRYFLPDNEVSLRAFVEEHFLNIAPEVKHNMVEGECSRCGQILGHVYPCIGCDQKQVEPQDLVGSVDV